MNQGTGESVMLSLTECYSFNSPPTSLHLFHGMHMRDLSDLRRTYQYVFLYAKPLWQPLDHFRPSHLKIWNSLPSHLSSIPTLPAFRRGLKHHLFLRAYPDSRSPGGITPSERILLRDTTQPTVIAPLENIMPSNLSVSHLSTYD